MGQSPTPRRNKMKTPLGTCINMCYQDYLKNNMQQAQSVGIDIITRFLTLIYQDYSMVKLTTEELNMARRTLIGMIEATPK